MLSHILSIGHNQLCQPTTKFAIGNTPAAKAYMSHCVLQVHCASVVEIYEYGKKFTNLSGNKERKMLAYC